jgi:hypothetical protein
MDMGAPADACVCIVLRIDDCSVGLNCRLHLSGVAPSAPSLRLPVPSHRRTHRDAGAGHRLHPGRTPGWPRRQAKCRLRPAAATLHPRDVDRAGTRCSRNDGHRGHHDSARTAGLDGSLCSHGWQADQNHPQSPGKWTGRRFHRGDHAARCDVCRHTARIRSADRDPPDLHHLRCCPFPCELSHCARPGDVLQRPRFAGRTAALVFDTVGDS